LPSVMLSQQGHAGTLTLSGVAVARTNCTYASTCMMTMKLRPLIAQYHGAVQKCLKVAFLFARAESLYVEAHTVYTSIPRSAWHLSNHAVFDEIATKLV
jgi:hypothetical protein